MFRITWIVTTFIAVILTGAKCLKNVSLQLKPEVVERGLDATLTCDYDLEGTSLYSLKWYRGNYEFYRYSPSENPTIKVFNLSWIIVDERNSNERQVTIKNVDFHLSGNFSCEVTTDAPFTTATSTKSLLVASVPKGKPVVISERGRYEVGETLKANCSTQYSKPPAKLSFTINDVPVSETSIKRYNYHQDFDNSQNSFPNQRQRIEINIILQSRHYIRGQLNLRCIAEIPGLYSQSSEVQLGSIVKEPVHERVTSDSISHPHHRLADLTIAAVVMILLHLR